MTEYTLSRRDALAALAAAGVAAGGLGALVSGDSEDAPLSAHDRETLVAIARAVYPDEVDGVAAFVEAYVAGRASDRPERAGELSAAIETLDEYARSIEDDQYVALPDQRQETILEEMGLDVVDPDPEGTRPARLRYYLVNELLFALYSSPTGGRLVGIENPQGHPGGTTSYQHDPE